MREFKPSFFLFLYRSFGSMWIVLFLAFGLFVSMYDFRNSLVFLVVGVCIAIHSQIFTKKVVIRDDKYIDIYFLQGPRIFSFKVEELTGLLLSYPLQSGSYSWGLVFTSIEKGTTHGIRVDFSYWTKDELIEVYNQISVLLPPQKQP